MVSVEDCPFCLERTASVCKCLAPYGTFLKAREILGSSWDWVGTYFKRKTHVCMINVDCKFCEAMRSVAYTPKTLYDQED